MPAGSPEFRCPRGLHEYPEFRSKRVRRGKTYFFCLGCKRTCDNAYALRKRQSTKPWLYGVDGRRLLIEDEPFEPDEMVILRLMAGDHRGYRHPSELREAVLRLLALREWEPQQYSLTKVAGRVGCSPRHVSYILRTERERKSS